MQTVGHHTCKKEGGWEYVLKHAPFLAEYNEKDGKTPFLGQGYYFWDDNLDLAHHWGWAHCRNKYFILEADLQFPDRVFLDLVGRRRDMVYLRELRDALLERGLIEGDWEIGKLIVLLRTIQDQGADKGVFPFKAIRAVDHSMAGTKQMPAKFVSDRNNFTLMNPRMIVCTFEKDVKNIRKKRLVT